jgi:myo-inositol-1(or 4)-monophosphatase
MKQIDFPLLESIFPVVREVAGFMRREINLISSEAIETKSLNSLVSFVDKQAEEMLVERLQEVFPRAGFITEEETIVTERKSYNWIIDPLDGTTNYLHGIPVYAISVALEHEGEVVLGIVYEVGRDECFYAVKGKGAFLNGKPIRVSTHTQLKDCLIATGFPYHDFDRMQNFLGMLTACFKSTRGVRRIGTAATDLVYTAAGRFDAFFEYGLSSWDVAAGSLIAGEAGAIVTDFSGGNNFLFGKEILVVQPNVKKAFAELMKECF